MLDNDKGITLWEEAVFKVNNQLLPKGFHWNHTPASVRSRSSLKVCQRKQGNQLSSED